MKIVFLDAQTMGDINYDKLKALGELTLYAYTKPHETLNRVKNADIVITNKVVIDKEIMDNSNIKLIQISATGMNNVDLEYAKKKGIKVLNVAGYSTKSVIQHTFALVLGLINKICYFDTYTRKDYPKSEIFTHIQNWYEIDEKKWGIIGLGEIGKGTAKLARAFGADVRYYSTSGKNRNEEFQRVSLQELLKNSDIITIHAPLNDKTHNLLNYDNLKLLKENAVLVNVGRGGIINENDLVKILKEKNIYVGLDVFENEPCKNSELLHSKNTLLSPHVAWTSIEARNKLMDSIIANIEEFIRKLTKNK